MDKLKKAQREIVKAHRKLKGWKNLTGRELLLAVAYEFEQRDSADVAHFIETVKTRQKREGTVFDHASYVELNKAVANHRYNALLSDLRGLIAAEEAVRRELETFVVA